MYLVMRAMNSNLSPIWCQINLTDNFKKFLLGVRDAASKSFADADFIEIAFYSMHPTYRDEGNVKESIIEEMDKHDDHIMLVKKKAFPEDHGDSLRVGFSKIVVDRHGFEYVVTEKHSSESWMTPSVKWSDILGSNNKLA